jgi:hypothetical protein
VACTQSALALAPCGLSPAARALAARTPPHTVGALAALPPAALAQLGAGELEALTAAMHAFAHGACRRALRLRRIALTAPAADAAIIQTAPRPHHRRTPRAAQRRGRARAGLRGGVPVVTRGVRAPRLLPSAFSYICCLCVAYVFALPYIK